ncbi:hypothetical protein XcvCFBP7113P_16530 [Xanthomonas citri pv. vignicola]|nr:hypothetical protein XcvCFBP7113P_16530 [Xanthomonas citri pv. vignicola]
MGEVIRGLAVGDPKFTGCKVTTVGEGRFRFHVYNHEFVQSVIGEADGMPGIFTIGETDVATQKEIERQEQISRDADEATEAARVAIEAIDGRLDKGSPPFSRTLTRRPIKAMRSVHVKAQEVHCRVQAWRG